MKCLFLINDASFLPQFLGRMSKTIIDQGDECLVVFNSKISEFNRKNCFDSRAKFISKVDWCIKNYKEQPSQEFGDLSWKEMFPIFERFKAFKLNHKDSIKIASHLYQFFNFVFLEEKPDLIIAEAPADLFHETAYDFCKKNNILYLGLEESKFNKRIDVYDKKHACSKYEKSFLELKSNDILDKEKEFSEKFIKGFLSHDLLPGHTDLSGVKLKQKEIIKHYLGRIKKKGFVLWRYFKGRRHFKEFDYESETIFKNALLAPFETEKRQIKILLHQNVFLKTNYKNDKFFLYPLHYQPESSTSVYATYYTDQLNTIKNIAFALPLSYKLYVKEHPASIGLRTGEFYKKIKRIPNVVLVSAHENVAELIKNSSGVVVLTGTIGLEAALSGKPSYVLGTTLYSYHPFCRKLKGFEDLKEKIKSDLSYDFSKENLKEMNCRFITAYLRNTIKGSIVASNVGKDDNDYADIYNNLKTMF